MKYPIKLFYSKEDKGYIATVPDLPGCSAFGETEEDAVREIKIATALWLKVVKKEGRKAPPPSRRSRYSGRILARLPRSLHESLAERAKDEGVSLNQLVEYLLSKEVASK